MHEASSPLEWILPSGGSLGERTRPAAPLARRRCRRDPLDQSSRLVRPGSSPQPNPPPPPTQPDPAQAERSGRLVVTRSEGEGLVVLLPRRWVSNPTPTPPHAASRQAVPPTAAPPIEVRIDIRKLTSQDVRIHLCGPRVVRIRRGEILDAPSPPPPPELAEHVGHLVIGRRPGQTIHLGEQVTLEVVWLRGRQARLRFTAPMQVKILRTELLA